MNASERILFYMENVPQEAPWISGELMYVLLLLVVAMMRCMTEMSDVKSAPKFAPKSQTALHCKNAVDCT
jgi:hypothetical protein